MIVVHVKWAINLMFFTITKQRYYKNKVDYFLQGIYLFEDTSRILIIVNKQFLISWRHKYIFFNLATHLTISVG